MQEYGRWLIRRLRRTSWLLRQRETRPEMVRYLYQHSWYAVRGTGRRTLHALPFFGSLTRAR